MLAAALFYIALIALVAGTILSAGFAMTRATIVRMTQPYAAAGYQRAASALQTRIAAQIQSAGLAQPLPSFTPIPESCANSSCTYTTGATIVLQPVIATLGPACDGAQTNCAANVQTNAYVGESRAAATIAVSVHDKSGVLVATRTATLLLRLLAAPPYVVAAGSRESGFDDAAATRTLGDDGGAPAATPGPCASATPGVADDTTVRVAYKNAATNACTDGSAWANASYSTTAPSW